MSPSLNLSSSSFGIRFHFHRSFDQRANRSSGKRLFARTLPCADSAGQLLFESFQLVDLLAHVGEVSVCHRNDISTGTLAASTAANDFANFVERKPKRLRLADKTDSVQFLRPVLPVTGFGSCWLGQELAPLIKTNCLDTHSSSFCEFTDLHDFEGKPYSWI